MAIQARVIRECVVGPPGECPVEVKLVGVTAGELRALEDQVEAQGISFIAEEVDGLVDVGETQAVSQETEDVGLVCPLEPDRSWDDSLCRELTGLDETAVELLREAMILQDERGR